MNQILDKSGPKKAKSPKNYENTKVIIRTYAIMIFIFAICFIGKGSYSVYESKQTSGEENNNKNSGPQIVLNADEDILVISVSHSNPIEEVSYQWYRGNVSSNEIKNYEEKKKPQTNEEDDEEILEENTIKALGEMKTEKGTGTNEMKLSNIGIPQGDSTIHIIVKAQGNVKTEFIQSYHTEIGVDSINPEINIKLQGTKAIITATDETEISKVLYILNDGNEVTVNERLDKRNIKVEVDLDSSKENKLIVHAVDKANNTGVKDKSFDFYVGKPTIEFDAEDDYSKIYVTVSYSKGIKSIEYSLNDEEKKVIEFDDPSKVKEYQIDIDSKKGDKISVTARAQEDSVYTTEEGVLE